MIELNPAKAKSYIGHGFWVLHGRVQLPHKFKATEISVTLKESGVMEIRSVRLSNGIWYTLGRLYSSKKEAMAHYEQMIGKQIDLLRSAIERNLDEHKSLQNRLKTLEMIESLRSNK